MQLFSIFFIEFVDRFGNMKISKTFQSQNIQYSSQNVHTHTKDSFNCHPFNISFQTPRVVIKEIPQHK